MTPAEPPPPEHTLREVLESQQLDTPVRVAADKLLEEIAARARAADARIAALERSDTWWQRLTRLAGAVGAGAVLSGLAVIGAQLIAHGDARAEARQQAARIQLHGGRLDALVAELDKIHLQVAADHSLLQFCAARLGASLTPSGATP